MKNVVIAEFDQGEIIEYPDAETKGSLDRQPAELVEDDYNFSRRVKEYPGFDVHHVETLQPAIYYIRGLVGKRSNGKTYVFSARVNLNNFGNEDFANMMDSVIEKIKETK